MGNTCQKASILVVLIIVIISIAGCEQQEFSNTKKFRIIADENRQLKEQLEQCHRQIEQCHQEKFDLNEKAQEEVKVVEDIALGYFEEIRILREQNQKLSAEIEQISR
jgi:predicted  nucleic acid-binding Zn-ribbon protein